MPAASASLGLRSASGRPSRRISPALAARVGAAEDGLGQLGQARAGEAGDAQDLALVQRERDVAGAMADAQPAHFQQRLGRPRRIGPPGRSLQAAADHRRHHVRQGGGPRLRGQHHGTVAQHRDLVADLEHLVQVVRDEHHAGALGRQIADQAQDQPDLAVGQRRGRLVEQQHAGPPADRLDDLDHLALVVGQVLDLAVGRDGDAVARQQLGGLRAHRAHAHDPERADRRLVGEEHVLRHGLGRDQVDVLVDGDDAARQRIVGAAQAQRLAVQRQGAGIGRVEPGQHLGQGRLAGPVLADQAVHAAGAHREVDAPQRLHAGEGFHDASAVEEARGRIGHRSQANGRAPRPAARATCRSPAGLRRTRPRCPW